MVEVALVLEASFASRVEVVYVTVVGLEFCVTVEKLLMICFVCRVSHGLESWWRTKTKSTTCLLSGPSQNPSPSIIKAIKTLFADVVTGALSVVRL